MATAAMIGPTALATTVPKALDSRSGNSDASTFSDKTKAAVTVTVAEVHSSTEKKPTTTGPVAPEGYKLVKVRKPDGTVVTVKRPISKDTKKAEPKAAPPAAPTAATATKIPGPVSASSSTPSVNPAARTSAPVAAALAKTPILASKPQEKPATPVRPAAPTTPTTSTATSNNPRAPIVIVDKVNNAAKAVTTDNVNHILNVGGHLARLGQAVVSGGIDAITDLASQGIPQKEGNANVKAHAALAQRGRAGPAGPAVVNKDIALSRPRASQTHPANSTAPTVVGVQGASGTRSAVAPAATSPAPNGSATVIKVVGSAPAPGVAATSPALSEAHVSTVTRKSASTPISSPAKSSPNAASGHAYVQPTPKLAQPSQSAQSSQSSVQAKPTPAVAPRSDLPNKTPADNAVAPAKSGPIQSGAPSSNLPLKAPATNTNVMPAANRHQAQLSNSTAPRQSMGQNVMAHPSPPGPSSYQGTQDQGQNSGSTGFNRSGFAQGGFSQGGSSRQGFTSTLAGHPLTSMAAATAGGGVVGYGVSSFIGQDQSSGAPHQMPAPGMISPTLPSHNSPQHPTGVDRGYEPPSASHNADPATRAGYTVKNDHGPPGAHNAAGEEEIEEWDPSDEGQEVEDHQHAASQGEHTDAQEEEYEEYDSNDEIVEDEDEGYDADATHHDAAAGGEDEEIEEYDPNTDEPLEEYNPDKDEIYDEGHDGAEEGANHDAAQEDDTADDDYLQDDNEDDDDDSDDGYGYEDHIDAVDEY